MEIELLLALWTGLVRNVAGLATHIERGVAAAVFWNVEADGVATQAKILFRVTRRWF